MKFNVFAVAITSLFIYSCASRQVVQTSQKGEDVKITRFVVKKTITVPNKALTENQAHGKQVYENNCAKWHKLFEPSSRTAEQWKPILGKMQIKAKISDEDAASVYNYLTAQI
ncbi:hypothetical protein FEDK69T_19230 [Flavobacterium enshiense DK69]|uniref:Cytochrome C n=1 Tax=Flavobacterium enshiense DK69 TaxID=1107311 RepID=V6SE50_9FLAO|nr:hypothetical protein [Flavobacterium enshiense]ESU22665.1 hypothetical protein FEDK69T_19230 [Flavobacterium enshiense DK69]KGO95633.1 hypothetical protein Q767_10430 [Flavobacterium enshiense DK69]